MELGVAKIYIVGERTWLLTRGGPGRACGQQFGDSDELVAACPEAADDGRQCVSGTRGVGLGNMQDHDAAVMRVAQHIVDNDAWVVAERITADDVVLHYRGLGRGDRVQRAGVIAAAGKPEIPGLPATEW